MLQPIIKEQLIQKSFIDFLISQNILASALTNSYDDYLNATGWDRIPTINNLQKFSTDSIVINAYIDYEIKQTRIDAGWVHPGILQTLAHLHNTELHIWKLGNDQALQEHEQKDYATYISSNNQKRVDLLFLRNNHFERLEIHGGFTGLIYPLNIPQTAAVSSTTILGIMKKKSTLVMPDHKETKTPTEGYNNTATKQLLPSPASFDSRSTSELQVLKSLILPHMLAQPPLAIIDTNEVTRIYQSIVTLVKDEATDTYRETISSQATNNPLAALKRLKKIRPLTFYDKKKNRNYDNKNYRDLVLALVNLLPDAPGNHMIAPSPSLDFSPLINQHVTIQLAEQESTPINNDDRRRQEKMIYAFFFDFLNKVNPVQGFIEYSLVFLCIWAATASAGTAPFFATGLINGTEEAVGSISRVGEASSFILITFFAFFAQQFFSGNNGSDISIKAWRNSGSIFTYLPSIVLALALVVPSIFSTAVIGKDAWDPSENTNSTGYRGEFSITLNDPALTTGLVLRSASALMTNTNFFTFRFAALLAWLMSRLRKKSLIASRSEIIIFKEIIEFTDYLSRHDPNTFMQAVSDSGLPRLIHRLQKDPNARNLNKYREIIDISLAFHANLKQAYQYKKDELVTAKIAKNDIFVILKQLQFISEQDNEQYQQLLTDYPLLKQLESNNNDEETQGSLLRRVHRDILDTVIKRAVDTTIITICLAKQLENPTALFEIRQESLPRRTFNTTVDFLARYPQTFGFLLAIYPTGQNWKAGSLVPSKIFNFYDITPGDTAPADIRAYFQVMSSFNSPDMSQRKRNIYLLITATSWISYFQNLLIHSTGFANFIVKLKAIRTNGMYAEFYNSGWIMAAILVPSVCYGLSQGGSSMLFPFIQELWVKILNLFWVSPTIFTIGLMAYDGATRNAISRIYLSTVEEAFASQNFYEYYQNLKKGTPRYWTDRAYLSTLGRITQPDHDSLSNAPLPARDEDKQERENLINQPSTSPSENNTAESKQPINNNSTERDNLVRLTTVRIKTLYETHMGLVSHLGASDLQLYDSTVLTIRRLEQLANAVNKPSDEKSAAENNAPTAMTPAQNQSRTDKPADEKTETIPLRQPSLARSSTRSPKTNALFSSIENIPPLAPTSSTALPGIHGGATLLSMRR